MIAAVSNEMGGGEFVFFLTIGLGIIVLAVMRVERLLLVSVYSVQSYGFLRRFSLVGVGFVAQPFNLAEARICDIMSVLNKHQFEHLFTTL